jgi:hypothetical protein
MACARTAEEPTLPRSAPSRRSTRTSRPRDPRRSREGEARRRRKVVHRRQGSRSLRHRHRARTNPALRSQGPSPAPPAATRPGNRRLPSRSATVQSPGS